LQSVDLSVLFYNNIILLVFHPTIVGYNMYEVNTAVTLLKDLR